MPDYQNLRTELESRLAAQHEWLLIHASGKSFALLSGEIELENRNDKILFSYLDEKGFQTWRVTQFETKSAEIILQLERNFARDRERVRLVPRALAPTLSDAVELARLEKANRVAATLKETYPHLRLARVELNRENGRLAQIFLESPGGGAQAAALSDVSGDLTPEILLSSACFWLRRLSARRRKPIESVWIAAEKKQVRKLQKLHALLRSHWQNRILIKELSLEPSAAAAGERVKDLKALSIDDLPRARARADRSPADEKMSETSRKIIALAPDLIDAVFAQNGETLRFRGLAFARVRVVAGRERLWFGVEKTKRPAVDGDWRELLELVENLKIYRRHDSPNRRHALFLSAAETWLEAALRRNVRLLDGNLRLSPLYHQFRAGRERVDLLALRSDGRLVIIELKTAPDREMVFQAADYWRRIEAERRAGNLARAHLFGDAEIADKPAICYLVAPVLSFHADFEFLARTMRPEIELYRFGLNENWREEIRVLQRR